MTPAGPLKVVTSPILMLSAAMAGVASRQSAVRVPIIRRFIGRLPVMFF
jgi:hypothetical protein